MVISTAHLSPLLSILFGILILIFPKLLNYLVAVYLILAGLLGIGLIGRPIRADALPGYRQPALSSTVTPSAPRLVTSRDRRSGPEDSARVAPARGRVARAAGTRS